MTDKFVQEQDHRPSKGRYRPMRGFKEFGAVQRFCPGPSNEYFHGDNGAGIGASHQTGWTGLVARLFQLFGLLEAARVLETGLL